MAYRPHNFYSIIIDSDAQKQFKQDQFALSHMFIWQRPYIVLKDIGYMWNKDTAKEHNHYASKQLV